MIVSNTRIFNVLLLSLLAMLLCACASSSSSTKTSQVNISAGAIEISEEYGVDAEITLKFKQAVTLINQEQYENAIKLLLEVTAETEKHSAPYVNLGIAYSKTGKIQEAEDSLLSALNINPVHPVTQNEMGMVYRQTGRFAEAKDVYENVLERYPQFLPARKNLGILCDVFMNDLECAIEHYEAYLSLKSDDEKVKLWLTDLKNRVSR